MRKKIIFWISIVLFIGIIVTVLLTSFVVNKVNIKFSVATTNDETFEISEKLNSSLNKKNLIFLSKNDVLNTFNATCNDFTYYKINSVSKQFPNQLNIEITERQEAYHLTYEDNSYILDGTGYVLSKNSASRQGRSLTNLYLKNDDESVIEIKLKTIEVGQTLQAQNDNDNKILNSFFSSNKIISTNDCVNSIYILNRTVEYQLLIETTTNVKIRIDKIAEKFYEKVNAAFDAYITNVNDYIKSYNEIEVYVDKENNIKVVWKNQ